MRCSCCQIPFWDTWCNTWNTFHLPATKRFFAINANYIENTFDANRSNCIWALACEAQTHMLPFRIRYSELMHSEVGIARYFPSAWIASCEVHKQTFFPLYSRPPYNHRFCSDRRVATVRRLAWIPKLAFEGVA